MRKTDYSIKLLRENEPPEGYHLAFSGGKDSICILQLAKMAGVKYKAYFYMTTLDPPDVLKFIKKFYPEVVWLRPGTSMFKLIVKKGLPLRQSRYCCQFLKEFHGEGETVITGIRADESNKRKRRKEIEVSKYEANKKFVHAIFNWTNSDVWTFINENKLPYPEIYLGCQNRVGCIACPMAPKKAAKDMILYPRFRAAFLKAIQKARDRGIMQSFTSAEEALEWWTSGISVKQFRANKRQYKLDFSKDAREHN